MCHYSSNPWYGNWTFCGQVLYFGKATSHSFRFIATCLYWRAGEYKNWIFPILYQDFFSNLSNAMTKKLLRKRTFANFKSSTCSSTAMHLNHYTKEPVWERHRKSFSSLQSCLSGSCWIKLISSNLIEVFVFNLIMADLPTKIVNKT